MPLYDFKCKDCQYTREHFIQGNIATTKKKCPKCKSENYKTLLSTFKLNIEYSNMEDMLENKIDPHVNETFAQIGKEFVNQDTKTLDNIHGAEKVQATFAETDE